METNRETLVYVAGQTEANALRAIAERKSDPYVANQYREQAERVSQDWERTDPFSFLSGIPLREAMPMDDLATVWAIYRELAENSWGDPNRRQAFQEAANILAYQVLATEREGWQAWTENFEEAGIPEQEADLIVEAVTAGLAVLEHDMPELAG